MSFSFIDVVPVLVVIAGGQYIADPASWPGDAPDGHRYHGAAAECKAVGQLGFSRLSTPRS
jgi:hypothetical protein